MLAVYSDRIETAPKSLQKLLEKDSRIVGFTIEADGVFIYTNSALWHDGNGAGTFRGDTVTCAIKRYKDNVTKVEGVRI